MNNYQVPGQNRYSSNANGFNNNYMQPQNNKNMQIANQLPSHFQYKENPNRFDISPTKKGNYITQNTNQHKFVYQNQHSKLNTHSVTNLKTHISNPNINTISHYNVPFQSLNQIPYYERNFNQKAVQLQRPQKTQFKNVNTFRKPSNSNYLEYNAGVQVCKTDKLNTLEVVKPQINKRGESNINIQKTAASSGVTHNKGENYVVQGIAGRGTFGVVYFGKDLTTGQKIAHKKVLQDKKYKNRELQILEQIKHPSIIRMRDSFISTQASDEYLNIIMDYYPQSLGQCIKKKVLNSHQIKVIIYQIFKGLQYLSSKGIAHRDMKPHNILIDRTNQKAVICDFGSAKKLVKGQKNLAYICSRCFRAAQLIFGATQYTSQVDVWSMGCIIFEMVNGKLPFIANSQSDLLVEMIKILGTPTQKDAFQMNENFDKAFFNKLPKKVPLNLSNVIKTSDLQLIDLISKILVYSPKKRLTPTQVLLHPYFDSLKSNFQCKLTKKESITKSVNALPFNNEKIDSQKGYYNMNQLNFDESVKNGYNSKDRQFPILQQRFSHHTQNSTQAKKGYIFRPQTQRVSPKKLGKPLPSRYLTKY